MARDTDQHSRRADRVLHRLLLGFETWRVSTNRSFETPLRQRSSSEKSPCVVHSLRIDGSRTFPVSASGPGPDLFSSRSLSHEQVEVCSLYSGGLSSVEFHIGLSRMVSWLVLGESCCSLQVHQPRSLRFPYPPCNMDLMAIGVEKRAPLRFPEARSVRLAIRTSDSWSSQTTRL